MAESVFQNVSVTAKANLFFDGKVVSHSVHLADGRKKTLGLIYSGSYTFNTGAPETMEIIAGRCRVRVADEADWRECAAGTAFQVPGQSKFEIAVETGIAEYICSFG
ncbi:MAG: pyrimidine/purine nucleoside phosphorylase [Lentisphaeria bacterium]